MKLRCIYFVSDATDNDAEILHTAKDDDNDVTETHDVIGHRVHSKIMFRSEMHE